jgi:hypothetical protein
MDYVLCIAALVTWEGYTTACSTYKHGEIAELLTSIIASHNDAMIRSPVAGSLPLTQNDIDSLTVVIDLAKDTLDSLPVAAASSIAEAEAGRMHFRGSS